MHIHYIYFNYVNDNEIILYNTDLIITTQQAVLRWQKHECMYSHMKLDNAVWKIDEPILQGKIFNDIIQCYYL